MELLDYSAIRKRDAGAAVRFVSTGDQPETAVYRGWMLTPLEYGVLYDALADRNIRLVNSPDEYLHCHWFPNSYPIIEGYTPLSVWMPAPASSWDMMAVEELWFVTESCGSFEASEVAA